MPKPSPKRRKDAEAWFRSRVPLSDTESRDLDRRAQQSAFHAAQIQDLRIVDDLMKSLKTASERGESFDDWKAHMGSKLMKEWGPGRRDASGRVFNQGHRLETIFRNACFPPEQLVSGAMVRAAWRRPYQGPMVQIVTDDGRNLTTTPNHPMLTHRGWVAAGELQYGDDLVSYVGDQDLSSSRDHDVAGGPTPIGEIFDALSVSGEVDRRIGTEVDFHGDGMNREIEVLTPDGELGLGRFAPLYQPTAEFLLSETNVPGTRFCHACHVLLPTDPRPCFCGAPLLDTETVQTSSDQLGRDSQLLGYVGDRLAQAVSFSDQFIRDIFSQARMISGAAVVAGPSFTSAPSFEASFPKPVDNGGAVHPQGRADVRGALPREVAFDRVHSTRIFQYSGVVFNLTTRHGYFLADGLYTGNTQSAYNQGRYRRLRAPNVLALRPYWRYTVERPKEFPHPVCTALHGTILPATDGFWNTRVPPLHHRCTGSVKALTTKEAMRFGVSQSVKHPPIQPGFGQPPVEGMNNLANLDFSKVERDIRSLYEAKKRQAP